MSRLQLSTLEVICFKLCKKRHILSWNHARKIERLLIWIFIISSSIYVRVWNGSLVKFVNKNDLEDHEREKLSGSLIKYLDDLGDLLYENTKIILNLEPKQKLDVDKKSLTILDKSAKGDLDAGLTLLQSGHTTAAYMILMRVAEFLVQQYYKKITGTLPKDIDSAWGQMLFSLQSEYKSKIDKTFQNLLYFLKDKRNEAQHPGKRFDEKDCNKLIIYLTEFIDYFVKNKSS